MADTRRFGRDPAEGSRATVEKQLQERAGPDGNEQAHSNDAARREADPAAGRHPAGSLPPFTDPAFSARPATPAVRPAAPGFAAPPEDTEFAGHPGFSQQAAKNRPPAGTGLTESMEEGDGRKGKSEGVNVPLQGDGGAGRGKP